MYYQNYEDYMRSVLGYPMENQNTYEAYNYSEMPYDMSQMYSNSARYSDEIMDLYPEIYRVVNPMVCKICDANTKPITRELVDQMTDEIYMNLESQPEMDTVVNVRINAPSELENKAEKSNRELSSKQNTSQGRISKLQEDNREKVETRVVEESRQRRPNNTLRDLIRILILNRLLGGFFPGRPPRPRPPRPPMRPPFQRDDRYYDPYFKF